MSAGGNHRDTQRCCDFTSALETKPEMSGCAGSAASVENDCCPARGRRHAANAPGPIGLVVVAASDGPDRRRQGCLSRVIRVMSESLRRGQDVRYGSERNLKFGLLIRSMAYALAGSR